MISSFQRFSVPITAKQTGWYTLLILRYAALDITEYLFSPELDLANYKRDLVGAAAFDRANGLLFVFEKLADEYKSIIHVWRVETE